MAKKKTKKKTKKKKPAKPAHEAFDKAIRAADEALVALSELTGPYNFDESLERSRTFPRRAHLHREPSQEEMAVLSGALRLIESSLRYCATLHPQGCPPQLQHVSAALDESHQLISDSMHYVETRFRSRAPEPRRRR